MNTSTSVRMASLNTKTFAVSAVAALAGSILMGAEANAQSLPQTSSSVTAMSAANYWTADRLKSAQPMTPRKLASAPQVSATAPAQTGQTQRKVGSPPQVDVGSSLYRQLFVPEATRQGSQAAIQAATVMPNNVGRAGDFFTTGRVFPDSAVQTYPNSAAGKLYFTDPKTGGGYVCSASMISPRVLITAGHCAAHADPSNPYFYTNFVYIPAFNNGAAPFGQWTPNYITTTNNWYRSNGSVPNVQDVAVMVLSDQGGRKAGSVTGWLGWWTQWGRSYPNNVTQLGYPCNLDSCAKMEINTAQGAGTWNGTVMIGSAMQGGSSGGPWIQDYGVAPAGAPGYTGGNWVIGVTSWGYNDTTQMVQGASILQNAGFSGNGFGDLWNAACGRAAGNC